MLRLSFVSLLAIVGVLVRMLDLGAMVPLAVERFAARGIVLMVVAAALVCAASVLRDDPAARERKRFTHWTAAAGAACFFVFLATSRALRFDVAATGGTLQVVDAYGPLTVWPALQGTSALLPVSLHLPLGHALLFTTTSLLLGATIARFVALQDATPGSGHTTVFGLVPLGLVPGVCPACVPLLLSFGGAALAPPASVLADPTGPLATLLALMGPVAALASLMFATRPGALEPRPRQLTVMHRVAVAMMLAVVLVPVAAAFGGMPHGASERQDATYGLFVLVTIGALVLTVLVLVLLLGLAYRYRARDGDEAADWTMRPALRRPLIVGFFVVPAVVIFGLGALSFNVLSFLEEPPEDPVYVEVIGSQFAWRFQNENGTTQLDELHIEAERPVVLNLSSTDVIHSFFVPDLGVKMDVMPGTTTQVWMEARHPGTYAAYCVEFCGQGHPEMAARIIVHPAGTLSEAPNGRA